MGPPMVIHVHLSAVYSSVLNLGIFARHQWLTPVILATQEAEIRWITFQSQPRQNVWESLSWTNSSQKRTGEWLKVHPEFKPQYSKKQNKTKKTLVICASELLARQIFFSTLDLHFFKAENRKWKGFHIRPPPPPPHCHLFRHCARGLPRMSSLFIISWDMKLAMCLLKCFHLTALI
jgi:hypothetical protein